MKRFFKLPKMPKADLLYAKTAVMVSNILRFILLAAIGISIWRNEWLNLFLASATLIMTFLPALIKRNYYITFPIELELAVVTFVFCSVFLGEIHGYYVRFWWWDVVLHSGAAIVLGFLGFLIVYSLYISKKIVCKPIFVLIFAFSFALAIGAVWEIFEFGMDSLGGFNMQKSGLVDTMWDLIIDSVGALVISVAGFFYVKSGHLRGFNLLLDKFEKQNPQLFNKENP